MLFITKGNLSQPKKGVYNEKDKAMAESCRISGRIGGNIVSMRFYICTDWIC